MPEIGRPWSYRPIDYQAISYYAAPAERGVEESGQVDPQLIRHIRPSRHTASGAETASRNGCGRAVMDSVSVKTTHKELLARHSVLLLLGSGEDYPDLVGGNIWEGGGLCRQFLCGAELGRGVSDGSFVYIPRVCAARWS